MTIKLSESEFEAQYAPKQKPGDDGLLDWDDVKNLPPEKVWTVVETGDPINDSWYALPGFHIVNKIGYLRSETPWTTDDMEAVWFESWPELYNYDPDLKRYVLYFPAMGLEVFMTGSAVLDGDGEDISEDLRDTLGEEGFAYLLGDYQRLVAEAYAAALKDDEAETHAARVAACNVPIIRKEDQ